MRTSCHCRPASASPRASGHHAVPQSSHHCPRLFLHLAFLHSLAGFSLPLQFEFCSPPSSNTCCASGPRSHVKSVPSVFPLAFHLGPFLSSVTIVAARLSL